MPNSNALRRIEDEGFPTDGGVTTVSTRQQAAPIFQFEKFNAHYDGGYEQKWQMEVLDRLLRYASMARGWDSYSGLPLRWDAGLFALWVLNAIMRPRTPVPLVVPSPTGGVQLEWHDKGIDLELHVTKPYDCEVWFEDRLTGAHISQELSNDLSVLVAPIAELTSR